MSRKSVVLIDGRAHYGGNDPAAQYATGRLNLFLEYLRANTDTAKLKALNKMHESEMKKPRTHARIIGLGSDPD